MGPRSFEASGCIRQILEEKCRSDNGESQKEKKGLVAIGPRREFKGLAKPTALGRGLDTIYLWAVRTRRYPLCPVLTAFAVA